MSRSFLNSHNFFVWFFLLCCEETLLFLVLEEKKEKRCEFCCRKVWKWKMLICEECFFQVVLRFFLLYFLYSLFSVYVCFESFCMKMESVRSPLEKEKEFQSFFLLFLVSP